MTSTRFPISSILGLSRSSSTISNQSSLYGSESSYPSSSFGISSFTERSSTLANYPAIFQNNASAKDLYSTQRETLASYSTTVKNNASAKDLYSTQRETLASYPTTVQNNASPKDLYSTQRETFASYPTTVQNNASAKDLYSTQRETLASYPTTVQNNASPKDLYSTQRETFASYPTTVQNNASAKDLYSTQRETFNERQSLMYDSSVSSASELLMFLKNRENASLNYAQFDQDVSNAAERNRNLESASPYSAMSDYSRRSNDSDLSDNLKNEFSDIADFIKCRDANLYSNSRFTKTISGDLLFPKKGYCSSESRNDLGLQNINRSTDIDHKRNSFENGSFDGERTDEHLLPFQTKVPCEDVIVLDD